MDLPSGSTEGQSESREAGFSHQIARNGAKSDDFTLPGCLGWAGTTSKRIDMVVEQEMWVLIGLENPQIDCFHSKKQV